MIDIIGRTNLRTPSPIAASSVIDVNCPCRGMGKCRGSIQVSRVWYEKQHTAKVEVISLLDSDEGEGDKTKNTSPRSQPSAAAAAMIKADAQDKGVARSQTSSADAMIKEDAKGEGLERQGLKPYYEKGDDVYAKWKGNGQWYRGTILSYKKFDCKSRYGETRRYCVHFNDGDEGWTDDFNVFSAVDYELLMDQNHTGEEDWEWKGVRKETDPHSSDEWAMKVGWYVVNTVDGKQQKFSTLVGALRAYDKSVIERYGNQTDEDDLNFPEEYRHGRFSQEPPDTSSSVQSLSSDSDDESRFSNGEEKDRQRSNKRIKIERDVNMIRLPPQLDGDHDEEGADIEFTEKALMEKRIFHVNSFVNADKKKNMGFRDFIELGFVAPCSDAIPDTVAPFIDEMTQSQLREAISQDKEWLVNDSRRKSRAKQVAMWLKLAEVGSFVVMRHEYSDCRYCPDWLKPRDENGNAKYIGPVFVIGVVTRKILPFSDADDSVASQMKGKLKFLGKFHPMSNICLVDWKRVGFKKDLKFDTQNYINRICQPTVANICTNSKKLYAYGATSESIRQDLFRNSLPLEPFLE